MNTARSMHFPKGHIPLYQRVSLYSGYILVLGLFSLLALKLVYQWVLSNPYLIFMACLLVVNFSLILILGARRFSNSTVRLRGGICLLTGSATLLFVLQTPLPITSVMIDVLQIHRSMEFLLMHHADDNRDKWRSEYRARGDGHTTVSFILPRPIQGRDEDLRVYMGYNPHREHFGRFPPPVEIDKVSFGTDILGLPLPLTVYEDKNLSTDAGVISGANVSPLVNHRVRAPIMDIMWDEARVRRDGSLIRIILVKLLWVSLYSAISIVILWAHRWVPRVNPIREAIEKNV